MTFDYGLMTKISSAKISAFDEFTKLEKEICGFWDKVSKAECLRISREAKHDFVNNPAHKAIYDRCIKVGLLDKKRYCWAVIPSRFEIRCQIEMDWMKKYKCYKRQDKPTYDWCMAKYGRI